MSAQRIFFLGVRIAVILTLTVIILGAYVRLSDAGLGCPDWPGCYGRLVAPSQAPMIDQANLAFPERPVEIAKAWKEMVHRYAAGLLGLVVLGLGALAWRERHRPKQPVIIPIALVLLIVFQSLLGMWTVTLQLKPIMVMGHLLGGFATLLLLWLLVLATRTRRTRGAPRCDPEPRPKAPEQAQVTSRHLLPWAWLGTLVLITQIALGGWTSANYAALACPDFPQCQGQWWPQMDFREAFVLWRGTGVDFEFGVLEIPARTAIHVAHRVGAATSVLLLGGLALFILWKGAQPLRRLAGMLLALLMVQAGLGMSNVIFHLPLPVAVAHNAFAALLLLVTFTLVHTLALTRPGPATTRTSMAATANISGPS